MKGIDVFTWALFCGAFFIWSYFVALPLLDNNKIDAWWFVVQTITTTGYGSLPQALWSDDLKLLSIKLMLGGATIWSLLISLFFKYLWSNNPPTPPVVE